MAPPTGKNEEWATWNPMAMDYQNPKFNRYLKGPGAQLAGEMQPGELAAKMTTKSHSHGKQRKVCTLLLLNVPQSLEKNSLRNMMQRSAQVLDIRFNKGVFYLDFATIADMDAALRGLEKNEFGIRAIIGRSKENEEKEWNTIELSEDEQSPIHQQEQIMVMNPDRQVRIPNFAPERPHIVTEPLVDKQLGKLANIFDEDVHNLERSGLINPNEIIDLKCEKYSYRTGTAHITFIKGAQERLQKSHKRSNGAYNTEKDIYEYGSFPMNLGNCLICYNISDLTCFYCHEAYYCGLKCFKADWPTHRQICAKPECWVEMVPKSEVTKKESAITLAFLKHNLKLNQQPSDEPIDCTDMQISKSFFTTEYMAYPATAKNDTPKNGSYVAVSSITKVNLVFVRSKKPKDIMKFNQLNSSLVLDAPDFMPLKVMPKIGQMVVVKWEHGYRRAMVLGSIPSTNNLKLLYVDYGNLEVQSLETLLDPTEPYKALKRFAVPVKLKGVHDFYMTDEVRTFMYNYLERVEVRINYDEKEDYVETTGVYQVELVDEATFTSFNKTLEELCTPKIDTGKDSEGFVIYRDCFKNVPLPTGKNIELVVMDNTCLKVATVSCTLEEYAKEIPRFNREFQRYANSTRGQTFAPRLDEVCVARYTIDDKWYRGYVVELVGDGFPTIAFLDYGNLRAVNIFDIRPYPPQLSFPVYTQDCFIDGLPSRCNDKLAARLRQLLPVGSKIMVDVEYGENSQHKIKMSKLIDQLKAEGLSLDESPESEM